MVGKTNFSTSTNHCHINLGNRENTKTDENVYVQPERENEVTWLILLQNFYLRIHEENTGNLFAFLN